MARPTVVVITMVRATFKICMTIRTGRMIIIKVDGMDSNRKSKSDQ